MQSSVFTTNVEKKKKMHIFAQLSSYLGVPRTHSLILGQYQGSRSRGRSSAVVEKRVTRHSVVAVRSAATRSSDASAFVSVLQPGRVWEAMVKLES